MKVLKPGLVHEYNADGSYNYTEHIETQLRALERLNPETGAAVRVRFENVRGCRYAPNDSLLKVAQSISERLDDLAPEGLYYGIPRDNSNLAGFWPVEWLKGGPADAVARSFGACVIGH